MYLNCLAVSSYNNYVRIHDALGRERVAYSDGVTVLIRRPDTATVRDGLADSDIDFQEDTHTLSANWEDFGDARSTLPSDRIIRCVPRSHLLILVTGFRSQRCCQDG